MNLCTSWALSEGQTRPVPMAQTCERAASDVRGRAVKKRARSSDAARDGLVGDDDLLHVLGGDAREVLGELDRADALAEARVVLVLRLADAEHGDHAGLEDLQRLLVDGGVVVHEERAALAVAREDVRHAHRLDHRRRDRARVGARVLEEAGLGAEVQLRVLDDLGHGADEGEPAGRVSRRLRPRAGDAGAARREDDRLAGHVGGLRGDDRRELLGVSERRRVHLPTSVRGLSSPASGPSPQRDAPIAANDGRAHRHGRDASARGIGRQGRAARDEAERGCETEESFDSSHSSKTASGLRGVAICLPGIGCADARVAHRPVSWPYARA